MKVEREKINNCLFYS